MTQLLVSTSNQVALPTFSKLQALPERFRQAFYKATQFTSLIAFPTFIGMATLTPELVTFLFGKEWLPSIPVMQILTFSGIIHTLSYFNASVFMAMGKPSWRLWLSFIEALFSIVACLFAVQWGIVAVALAYVISIYLVFPISQAAVSKLIHVPILIYLQQFMTSLMASTVMATAILMTKYFLVNFLDAKFILLIGTMIGIIVYSLTIRLIDPKLFQYVWELFRIVFSKKKPNLLKS
jgi:PST family polysaccharide transporter